MIPVCFPQETNLGYDDDTAKTCLSFNPERYVGHTVLDTKRRYPLRTSQREPAKAHNRTGYLCSISKEEKTKQDLRGYGSSRRTITRIDPPKIQFRNDLENEPGQMIRRQTVSYRDTLIVAS